jgi:hypothetical protein
MGNGKHFNLLYSIMKVKGFMLLAPQRSISDEEKKFYDIDTRFKRHTSQQKHSTINHLNQFHLAQTGFIRLRPVQSESNLLKAALDFHFLRLIFL